MRDLSADHSLLSLNTATVRKQGDLLAIVEACARHGVLRGQIDISARLIWIFEKTAAASDVKWPRPERLAAKMVKAASS